MSRETFGVHPVPLWRSYLREAADYATRSLETTNPEGRAHWRSQAEWALGYAVKKFRKGRSQ